MLLTKATKTNIILFLAAFLLCGLLHVLLYSVDFTYCIVQLYCGVLTIFWAVSVRKRVVDDRLRTLMLWVAVCMLLLFILQILRYDLFTGNMTAQRYLWYMMYISLTAEPVLCFFLTVFIHRPKDLPLPRRYYLLVVLAVLLVLGILTNDLHFRFTSFPSGILDDNGQEVHGWLYYVAEVFIYGLSVVDYILLLHKTFRYVGRKYRWLPLVPLLILLVYFFQYPLAILHPFQPRHIWNMGEMQTFCVIAIMETCIQTGMIPANRGYELLFSAADLPAAIVDGAGKCVYKTAAAHLPLAGNEHMRLVSHPIHGGSIEFLVDLTQVQSLNQQIAEATQQIETRNTYIAQENRIKQERAELKTRNRLYERISGIVKPQLIEIDALLTAPGGCGKKELARIAVLQAYVKRRSNMELLAVEGTLPAAELASAVRESLDYVRLCGANQAVSAAGDGSYPAAMVIAAYEQIEEIAEKSLDTLSDMIVAIHAAGKRLTVRMMLNVGSFSYEARDREPDKAFSRRVSITKEDRDMIIVLTFTEGGEDK